MRIKSNSFRKALLMTGATSVAGVMLLSLTVNAATPTNKIVTVTMGFQPNEVTNAEIALFEKSHPYIRIKRDPSATNLSDLAAQLASGNAPDIIRIQGAQQLGDYVLRGIAMNIQPLLNKSKVFNQKDFFPAVNEFRWNGHKQGTGPLYGLPETWSQDFTLWYNKALFRKAHIPYLSPTKPVTWQYLMNIAKKLTVTKNGQVQQYGLGYWAGYGTAPSQSMMLLPLQEMGQSLWSSNYSTAHFNSPAAMKVENMWINAVKGNLGPNPVNKNPNWSGNLFLDGKVAIEMCGFWFEGSIATTPPVSKDLADIAMAPTPVWSGGKEMSPTGAATGGIIWTGTKHLAQTWAVFQYFFGQSPEIYRVTHGEGLPIQKSFMKYVPHQTPWEKEMLKWQEQNLKYQLPLLNYNPYLGLEATNTAISQYLTPVYFGKASLAQADQQLNSELDSIIRSRMQLTKK